MILIEIPDIFNEFWFTNLILCDGPIQIFDKLFLIHHVTYALNDLLDFLTECYILPYGHDVILVRVFVQSLGRVLHFGDEGLDGGLYFGRGLGLARLGLFESGQFDTLLGLQAVH